MFHYLLKAKKPLRRKPGKMGFIDKANLPMPCLAFCLVVLESSLFYMIVVYFDQWPSHVDMWRVPKPVRNEADFRYNVAEYVHELQEALTSNTNVCERYVNGSQKFESKDCLVSQLNKFINRNFYENDFASQRSLWLSAKDVTFIILLSQRDETFLSFLRESNAHMRQMHFYIATDSKDIVNSVEQFKNVHVSLHQDLSKVSTILKKLTKSIETHFTLLWTSVQGLQFHSLDIVGSIRYLINANNVHGVTFPIVKSKRRFLNCYEVDMKLYKVTIRLVHRGFVSMAPKCSYSRGPVFMYTTYLKAAFNKTVGNYVSNEAFMLDFFISLAIRGLVITQCLTCGAIFATKPINVLSSRDIFLPFVLKWSLNIISTERTTFKYSCEDTNFNCAWKTNEYGLGMPLCCSEEQNKHAIEVIKFCENYNVPYMLTAGTALAAVKLNRCMPWDIDADIFFQKKYRSLVDSHISKDLKRYSLGFDKVDKGYGIGMFGSRYVGILTDFYPFYFEPGALAYGNIQTGSFKPTKSSFFNKLVAVPFNPGSYGRQRYGYECFQHTLHWRSVGGSNLVEIPGGRFKPCKYPDHHACLDTFMPDGNMQF